MPASNGAMEYYYIYYSNILLKAVNLMVVDHQVSNKLKLKESTESKSMQNQFTQKLNFRHIYSSPTMESWVKMCCKLLGSR